LKGGYGPGILASLATLIFLPYLFTPGFTLAKIEIGRSLLLLGSSLLVSGLATAGGAPKLRFVKRTSCWKSASDCAPKSSRQQSRP